MLTNASTLSCRSLLLLAALAVIVFAEQHTKHDS